MSEQKLDEEIIENNVIDLHMAKRGELDESQLAAFGSQIKLMLAQMFPGDSSPFGPPFKIRGTRKEIDSFAQAMSKERKYMDSYIKHGLDNPRTYRNRYSLERAIRDFERTTGIKWPVK